MAIAGNYDIWIEKGKPFSITLAYRQTDGVTPAQLDNSLVRARIAKVPGLPHLGEFSTSINSATDEATLTLTAAQTAALPAGQLCFDVVATIDGSPTFLLAGHANVLPRVTQ